MIKKFSGIFCFTFIKLVCISGKRSKTESTILSTLLSVVDWADDVCACAVVDPTLALAFVDVLLSGTFFEKNLDLIEDFLENWITLCFKFSIM